MAVSLGTLCSESTLPPKEMLVATFSRFGLLKESEIQVLNDSTVQIVYERSSDAKICIQKSGESKPFGRIHFASFKLHVMPDAPNASPTHTKRHSGIYALNTRVTETLFTCDSDLHLNLPAQVL
ncbi:UNVERIFIED_CONTAM: hypothetical protein Sradi_4056200 [Sesamum radiatum]|uniref:Uncharacterized protein n=1 Tax=Sesamum radiatum TaxID=300843 RepID=A0AAW2PLZ9_SESRA